MSDSVSFDTQAGNSAAKKASNAGVGIGEGRVAPPSKKVASSDGTLQNTSKSSASTGGRAYQRSRLGELKQMRGKEMKRTRSILEFPPVFEQAVGRNVEFLKRAFSPQTLFDPLPGPLKYSLNRNFGFLTRIFTQIVDPNQQKQVRESIPGLAKK